MQAFIWVLQLNTELACSTTDSCSLLSSASVLKRRAAHSHMQAASCVIGLQLYLHVLLLQDGI